MPAIGARSITAGLAASPLPDLRVDDAIEAALLQVVGPGAIAAAVAAEAEAAARRDQVREALPRDLEAARYVANRAFRQYDAADPANRLVAAELETRWIRALLRVTEIEAKIAEHDAATTSPLDTSSLAAMADDLRAVWSAPTTDARLLPRRRSGQRNSTTPDSIDAVRQLVLIANDDLIAGLLNRSKLTTGYGNCWTRERATSLRSHHRIPLHRPVENGVEPWLNLTRAAAHLGVSPKTLRIAAESAEIKALHPLPEGPWIFSLVSLDEPSALASPRHPAGLLQAQDGLFSSTTETDGCCDAGL
jgi:hypothetical protein